MDNKNVSRTKKLQAIAFEFLNNCTDTPAKVNGKLTSHYYRLYKFICQAETIQLKIQSLYEFALKVKDSNNKRHMTFYEFVQNAEKWQSHIAKQTEIIKPTKQKEKSDVPVYKEFSLADLDDL
jgi:hypothetical protein